MRSAFNFRWSTCPDRKALDVKVPSRGDGRATNMNYYFSVVTGAILLATFVSKNGGNPFAKRDWECE